MAQYIDKAAVVAEIERLARLLPKEEGLSMNLDWARNTLSCLYGFLNAIEVKEVDLEEKATQLSQKYFPDEENIWARANIEAQRCKSACIEMVEWFKA